MVKEIKYSGFTASPSDYECPDGDLAAVLNVVPEEGSLSPIMPPRQPFQLTDGGSVRFVHETSYIRNYIILHPDNTITWRTQDDADQYSHGTLSHNFSDRTIHQINAIGNTLIVLADDGMHYFLWKGYRNGSEQQGDDPKEYLYLGTHLPELSLSFGLQSHTSVMNMDSIGVKKYSRLSSGGADEDGNHISTFPGYFGHSRPTSQNTRGRYDPSGAYTFLFPPRGREGLGNSKEDAEDINALIDHINAGTEKLISNVYEEGLFVFPFFVRYAYRMYDGSLSMHSQPILMVTVTDNPLSVQFRGLTEGEDRELIFSSMTASTHCFDLDYSANTSDINELKKWNDIIKSVEIFVSKPIYTYRQMSKEYDIGVQYRPTSNPGTLGTYSTFSKSGDHYICSTHDKYNRGNANYFFVLKDARVDQITYDIESCNLFYLLQSIDARELKTERTTLLNRTGYIGHINLLENDPNINLTNIVAREVMSDDYDSHDFLLPENSFVYNSRLQVANIQKRLYSGYNSISQFTFTNGDEEDLTDVEVYYFIKQDNKTIVVKGESARYNKKSALFYLYYPNKNAYRAVVKYNDTYYELPLKMHEKLNGAYFFGGLDFVIEEDVSTTTCPTVSSDIDNRISIKNKIYTSEVNNPYYFPLLGINTVGTGIVIGMSSASKALSQGQFGQFPLYAFTTEGVWALEVETDKYAAPGLYKACQPFTRDVCINPDSITQLDSSVLFATDRGLMIISGSNSLCISDSLDYSQAFQVSSLPHSDKLLSLVGFTPADLGYVSFHEFIKGCRMLYSYVQQHIIVFNRDYPYAYVYSLKSKSWGMMPSTIALTIPSYPEAIAQLADGTIVDYSSVAEGQETTGIKGVLITRPLKLDLPNALKTVDTVIQRGNFQRGHVKSAIYGSRDLINWNIVWTSADHCLRGFRGTPYKYFRIVLLCDLAPTESIYGCTIQYTPRFTNRLR